MDLVVDSSGVRLAVRDFGASGRAIILYMASAAP